MSSEYFGQLYVENLLVPVIKFDNSMVVTPESGPPYLDSGKITTDTAVYPVIYANLLNNIPASAKCQSNTVYSDKTFGDMVNDSESPLSEIDMFITVQSPGQEDVRYKYNVSDLASKYDSDSEGYKLGSFHIPIPISVLSTLFDATKLFGKVGAIVDNDLDGNPFNSAGGSLGSELYGAGSPLTDDDGNRTIHWPLQYQNESEYEPTNCISYTSNQIVPGTEIQMSAIAKDTYGYSDNDENAYAECAQRVKYMDKLIVRVMVQSNSGDSAGYTLFAHQYELGTSESHNAVLGTYYTAETWDYCYHENKTQTEYKEPTCSEDGYIVYQCDDCGKQFEHVLPATEHTVRYKYYVLSEDGSYKEVTSSEYNESDSCKYIKSVCSHCETTLDEILEEHHKEDAIIHHEAKEPTCELGGHPAYTECTECNTTVGYEYINPLGHDFKLLVSYPATGHGHNPGYNEYGCIRCGTTYREYDNGTGEPNHTFTDTITVEPTYVEDGYTINKCHYCDAVDESSKVIIPKLSHPTCEYNNFLKRKEPTCTEPGYEIYFCDCGEQKTTEIPAKGHTVVVDEAVDPTYTTTGLTEGSHCSVCGEVLVPQQVIDKVECNHPETYTVVRRIATTEQDGRKDTICKVCGYVHEDIIPALPLDNSKAEQDGPAYVINKSGDQTTASLSMAHPSGELYNTSGSDGNIEPTSRKLTWDVLIYALANNQTIDLLGHDLISMHGELANVLNDRTPYVISRDGGKIKITALKDHIAGSNGITISPNAKTITISLNYGSGLQVYNNKVSVKPGKGISVDGDGVHANLEAGDGIKIEDNNGAKKITNTAVSKSGKGVKVNTDNTIDANLSSGPGITIGDVTLGDNTKAKQISAFLASGPGINIIDYGNAKKISTAVGNGITFDSKGALSLLDRNAICYPYDRYYRLTENTHYYISEENVNLFQICGNGPAVYWKPSYNVKTSTISGAEFILKSNHTNGLKMYRQAIDDKDGRFNIDDVLIIKLLVDINSCGLPSGFKNLLDLSGCGVWRNIVKGKSSDNDWGSSYTSLGDVVVWCTAHGLKEESSIYEISISATRSNANLSSGELCGQRNNDSTAADCNIDLRFQIGW